MTKFVYRFHEGDASMRNLLGGKGANLAEMTNLGMPIPQGFSITTEACNDYYAQGKKLSPEIQEQILATMAQLEAEIGKGFGDMEDPFLVSVRSGARVSMPGMMDTILNLGLNDQSVKGLAAKSNNPRFAYDSYRRFIQMFADVVKEVPKKQFEDVLTQRKAARQVEYDYQLQEDDLKDIVSEYKELYRAAVGTEFPQDPYVQLMEAVEAVFRSWDNPRAIVYRRMNGIPHEWGTAVNVQRMVFGNMGDDSGTGVAFTRDPSTGEKTIYGEYLINAQGEDVVAGIRTPKSIAVLEQDMPHIYKQFENIAQTLENHYRDMQDMEFTIQEGKLYFLQTRNGKRTAAAALKVAVDMVDEGMITEEEAIMRVEPGQLEQFLHPNFDRTELAAATVIGKGLPASPGSGAGQIYFTAEEAKAAHEGGQRVILVRGETSPEDIEGMAASEGVLTARGGRTSHAAVVARSMGICCVAGCGQAHIDEENKLMELNGKVYREGDFISLDGSTGNIYAGDISTCDPSLGGEYHRFMSWTDSYRRLKVRTNADTPEEAEIALEYGAQGIGLTRTEHMFFQESRIPRMQQMILASTPEERKTALSYLQEMQRQDFIAIYERMGELPVTVRLLDPPLHEFLPSKEQDMEALAEAMGLSFEAVKKRVDELHEFNPMMGHRGCRLSVTYPEIAEMQTRAIIEAAIIVNEAKGLNIVPEIMIPLAGEEKELKYVEQIVVATADQTIAQKGAKLNYQIGTMIELPRACLVADEIAKVAHFFSFGTNDLTQMTFGFSRDDAAGFLNEYYDKRIYSSDPFAHLDTKGVGQLVKMAVEKGRSTRPNLKLGICGEHGGDPSSIKFCHQLGLDYVSCSPYRVPIARLAAAQAAIEESK